MSIKTKAAILHRLKKPLVIEEIDVPALEKGQILIKMKTAGVCRSQLSEIQGLRGKDSYLPHLLGHEASAIVIDVGAGVKKVKMGDSVIASWIKSEGINAPGGIYGWGKKKVNSGGVAVFTELAVVSENRITKISKAVPSDIAAVIGCAVATGAGIIRHEINLKANSSIAIFGVGGIGASAVMAAKMVGCKNILAIDVSDRKLSWVKGLGATKTINAKKNDPLKAIMKIFPSGVDFAIEATGLPSVAEQALESLNSTGVMVIAGHSAHDTTFRVDPFKLIEGRKIIGTWGGATVPEIDFSYYARMWRSGKLPIDKLITHHYPFLKINDALALLEKGYGGRIVLEFD